MRISVAAHPNAREKKVEQIGEHEFRVSVQEPPIQGKANRAIAQLLAEHFQVSAQRVKLISGFASRRKIFEIG